VFDSFLFSACYYNHHSKCNIILSIVYLPLSGGILAFYDLLDPNIEVTSDAAGILEVKDEDGSVVPGLFMIPSTEVISFFNFRELFQVVESCQCSFIYFYFKLCHR